VAHPVDQHEVVPPPLLLGSLRGGGHWRSCGVLGRRRV
jgi:hypothetical protein